MTQLQKDLSEFSFQIVNNTPATQQMYFLSNPSNTQDISNQHTQYSWDITSIVSTISIYDIVTIEARTVNSPNAYQTYSANIISNTLNGIVTALNTLQIASFYYETVGGNTYIRTYNDQIEFGQLNIIDTNATGLSVFLNVNLPYAASGDGFSVFNVLGGYSSPNINNPITSITNYTAFVTLGDTVYITGQSPTIPNSIIVGVRVIINKTVSGILTNLFDGVVAYNTTYSAIPPSVDLTDANGTYELIVQYPDLDANYSVQTTSTSGNISIDYGQGSVPIWLNPTTQIADFATSVSNGQFITVSGVAPNTGSVLTVRVNIRQQDISTGVITTISNNLYSSGAPFNIQFPVVTGFAYQIKVTDI